MNTFFITAILILITATGFGIVLIKNPGSISISFPGNKQSCNSQPLKIRISFGGIADILTDSYDKPITVPVYYHGNYTSPVGDAYIQNNGEDIIATLVISQHITTIKNDVQNKTLEVTPCIQANLPNECRVEYITLSGKNQKITNFKSGK